MKIHTQITTLFAFLMLLAALFMFATSVRAAYHFANYSARSPLHIYATTGKSPVT